MKKIICIILSIYCFVLAAYAQGEKQQFVIKNGDNVTVYQITNIGGLSTNVDIEVSTFTNITATDLRSSEVPEEAWKMCGASENGFYSSEINQLIKENESLQTDYYNLKTENEKNVSRSNTCLAATIILGIIALILVFCFIGRKK